MAIARAAAQPSQPLSTGHVASSSTKREANDLFIVEGMFCSACAVSLQHRLAKLPGVEEAAVDLATGAALLRWQPGYQDSNRARGVIAALGYSARRPGAAAQSDAANDFGRALQLNLVVALFFGMWTMLPSIALYLGAAPNAAVAHGLAWSAAAASLPVIIYAGRPFYAMTISTLRAGVAGIDALVTFGVLGAVVLSSVSLAQGGADVYFEVAVALITLQLIARLMELKIARAGRDALAGILDLAAPKVQRLTDGGPVETVALSEVVAGDVLIADVGETLVVDGMAEGVGASLDRHLLTGESQAVRIDPGQSVCAGEVVVDGPLRFRVTAAAGERRIDNLARQVRALLMHKPDWQRGVDRVARHFLLLATLAAGAGALLAIFSGADGIRVAERALAVFVIACPCSLSLAAPLAGLAATRRSADAGMLLRDLRCIARRGQIGALFLDKTGTLTEGRPVIQALQPVAGVEELELLATAAFIEHQSGHPLAKAIVRGAIAADINCDVAPPGIRDSKKLQYRTVVGCGVLVECDEVVLRAGSGKWFAREGVRCPLLDGWGFSRVWIAIDDKVLGAIDFEDPVRAGAAAAIEVLMAEGAQLTILSGDDAEPVARIARQLGIEGISHRSPEDKVAHVKAAAARGCVTAFVGDGLNDGPAIAAADLGVAVEGALDAARTASAVTMLRGGVDRIPELLSIIATARRILRQNITWAIIYNALAVPAALVGWVHPAVAAAAMAVSSVTVLINSMRWRRPAVR